MAAACTKRAFHFQGFLRASEIKKRQNGKNNEIRTTPGTADMHFWSGVRNIRHTERHFSGSDYVFQLIAPNCSQLQAYVYKKYSNGLFFHVLTYSFIECVQNQRPLQKRFFFCLFAGNQIKKVNVLSVDTNQ